MHPEINEIRRKLANAPWPKFLHSVKIAGLRNWTGQEIRFQFPVCVVAGENGTGKSTVLKAAAAAYSHPTDIARTFYPSKFFPDTAWEHVANASITYKVREGTTDRDYTFKKLARWRLPNVRPKRYVIWQDIARTLPLDATAGYVYLAKRTAKEASAVALSPEITKYYSSIMGRSYDSARIATTSMDSSRPVGVVSVSGNQFSQFHQGAGEDATLDLLTLLQNVPDTSLIIIDETEASLHPRSQRRLIHFLLWLARTKQIQVIISTHSPYVIEELPLEARIFLDRGSAGISVFYGVTADYALNRMDDIAKPELYLFAEDEESVELTLCLLRYAAVDVTRLRCMAVGPENVVSILGDLAVNSKLPVPSLGICDPDSGARNGCVTLPGTEAPEKQVFSDVIASGTAHLANRLGVAEPSVRDALTRATSLIDHHEWPHDAGRALGQTAGYLWATMCQVWVQHCVAGDKIKCFADDVKSHLK